MKDFSNVKIKYSVEHNQYSGFPVYKFKVFTDVDKFAKISGHRFVNLILTEDYFSNDLQTLLGFLKLQPPIESPYITCGNKLEQPIIDAVTELHNMKDVETFSFEDLDNGTNDFHFIRDLEYTNEEGERVTGEVKTFYNKQKLKGWENIIPDPHISWWLQLRLELDVLKDIGGKGKIFYYFVDKSSMNAVLNDRPFTIKPKNLFASDYIVKLPEETRDPFIEKYLGFRGLLSFADLKREALYKRDELSQRYFDDETGEVFYYVEVPIHYPWYEKNNHVENFIKDAEKYIRFERE